MTDESLEKLQQLLRTIFQFDCADLDFGIYRTLNYKRERIEECRCVCSMASAY